MQRNNKVALFDFCETIANFQTADAYVRFVQSHSTPSNLYIRYLHALLARLRVMSIWRKLQPKRSIDKRMTLMQLRGRSYEEMDRLAKDYYESQIKPNLITQVVEELLRLKRDGYKCYVVSGGFDIYLKYFCEEYSMDGLLSTKIGFKKDKCTGCFDGHDCMFDYKIDYIKSTIAGDTKQWMAFTDSITDLPMLELVGNPIVVSREKSQKWAENRYYKQIIW